MFPWRKKSAPIGQTYASTAGYYSESYTSVGAGSADDDFYGIPLSNIVKEVTLEEKIGFIALVVLLLLKSHIKILRNFYVSIVFWMIIPFAAYTIKEIALYPLVSTIILTRTTYPWLVVIPHCISAAASYRKERSSSVHYLSAFCMGFFCYGFGGSIISDILMGLPATALGHARIVPCYIFGWILVWFSPFDIVYKLLTDKSSFFRYFMNACEAVDAVTTPMGRVSRSARELNNQVLPPIIAGILAGTGGSVIRYWERVVLRKGNERVAEESFRAVEGGIWRSLCYSVIWWYIAVYKCTAASSDVDTKTEEDDIDYEERHCREYNGNNLHRFIIVCAHVVWNITTDLGITGGHPFVFLSRKLREIGAKIAIVLKYGPQPDVDKPIKIEKRE